MRRLFRVASTTELLTCLQGENKTGIGTGQGQSLKRKGAAHRIRALHACGTEVAVRAADLHQRLCGDVVHLRECVCTGVGTNHEGLAVFREAVWEFSQWRAALAIQSPHTPACHAAKSWLPDTVSRIRRFVFRALCSISPFRLYTRCTHTPLLSVATSTCSAVQCVWYSLHPTAFPRLHHLLL